MIAPGVFQSDLSDAMRGGLTVAGARRLRCLELTIAAPKCLGDVSAADMSGAAFEARTG